MGLFLTLGSPYSFIRKDRSGPFARNCILKEKDMKTERMEAFSDAVIAIIMTIMVIEIKVPESSRIQDLIPLIPVFLSYVLSFVYLGIYWTNHHHVMHAVDRINGKILWANLHLLFWLSLIPFVSGWMGENGFESITLSFYGVILLMASLAYLHLQHLLIKANRNSVLSEVVGKDLKGKVSALLYVIGILFSWIWLWVAGVCYLLVALIWLIPDKRIEKTVD